MKIAYTGIINLMTYSIILLTGIACTKIDDPLAFWGNKITIVTGNTSGVPVSNSLQIAGSSITCNVSRLSDKTRGICWGEINNVTVLNNTVTQGAGVGSFSATLTNLLPGRTYYYRTYIILVNPSTALYGEIKSFNTPAVCPTVSTNAITSITTNSATTGGNVTADGGSAVTVKGIVFSTTNTTPAIGSGTVINGSPSTGIGAFTANMSGLNPGTTYYVRGFATNSAGTCYGTTVTFSTTAVCPTVSTTGATSITSNSATTGGNVTASGGPAVTAKGIVFSTTNTTPAIGSGTVINGSPSTGIGAFTANMNNLIPGTIYYARAFATNSVGTCYGATTNFISLTTGCPSVTTTPPSRVNSTTARVGGNVSSAGSSTVTSRGVIISTSNTNPTVGGAGVTTYTNGLGIGTFTTTLSVFTPGVTYYIRAFATNASCTNYEVVIDITL